MTQPASDPLDLRHAATDRATIVSVPNRRLFAIDGLGDPGAAPFRLAADALFAAAESLRAALHRRRVETRIGLLEVAWWTHPEPPSDRVAEAFADRRTWHWQLMIEVPLEATDDEAAACAAEQGGLEGSLVRVIQVREGLSAQILHVGAGGDESAAVQRLYDLVLGEALAPHGHLHEIHLADPRRVGDDRRRIIIRLPILREPGPSSS
jgi:hypothetical protein